MLDGDEGPALTLGLASHTVVGVGPSVFAAHGVVGAVTLDGVARAVCPELFHHTHGIEQALLFTQLCTDKNI